MAAEREDQAAHLARQVNASSGSRHACPKSAGLYKALGFVERNKLFPQLSDHYFTGDYPVKPKDLLGEGKVTQLSLLSGKSIN
jgi:hypothetical protein